ncbi:rRNA maturation RNase YbeY [Patescibacteria group bacterium]|nr:rRNA maturation RNase YbeY [Patescibacteria group bacterium]
MKTNLIVIDKRGLSADFSWLANLEKIFKKRFYLKKEISIALLSPLEIKQLNHVYRNKNKVTDVLSFQINSKDILGEVLICLDQAKKQAKKTIKSELQLLTVHGILHLLGYDHEKNLAEEKKQNKEQEEILTLLNK